MMLRKVQLGKPARARYDIDISGNQLRLWFDGVEDEDIEYVDQFFSKSYPLRLQE